MLDLVIRGGQVITPQGVGAWDVGVEGERIRCPATSPASSTPPASSSSPEASTRTCTRTGRSRRSAAGTR